MAHNPRPNYRNIRRYAAYVAAKKEKTMAIIHHFDNFTGRFIELEVSDAHILDRRRAAQEREQGSLQREQVLRRCLRLLDSGQASADYALGLAYNSGHAIGSGQKDMTELDRGVLEALIELDEHELSKIKQRCPGFVRAVDALRKATINDSF